MIIIINDFFEYWVVHDTEQKPCPTLSIGYLLLSKQEEVYTTPILYTTYIKRPSNIGDISTVGTARYILEIPYSFIAREYIGGSKG